MNDHKTKLLAFSGLRKQLIPMNCRMTCAFILASTRIIFVNIM